MLSVLTRFIYYPNRFTSDLVVFRAISEMLHLSLSQSLISLFALHDIRINHIASNSLVLSYFFTKIAGSTLSERSERVFQLVHYEN